MNKIILFVLLIILIGGGLFYLNSKMTQPGQQTVNQQPTTQTTAQNKVEGNTITISNFSFNPGTLTVKQGATVTWINQDSVTHTVKSNTFNSSDLSTGDKFAFTFTNKGSFDYSCGIHPSMTGKIIVE